MPNTLPKYITQIHYPNTLQVGDVKNVVVSDYPKIDLLIGGSPCQGFSKAGDQLNFNDPRSKLFFEYVRILSELREINSNIYFLLENVVMKQEWQDVISEYLGVQPILINSSLVSAQNRERLYWTNIPIDNLPKDKGIKLSDILMPFPEKYRHTESAIKYMNRCIKDGRNHWDFGHHSDTNKHKSSCITRNMHKGVPYNVLIDRTNVFDGHFLIRKFTPNECELLQTLPIDYTKGISDTQRYMAIGNGWTVDVIAYIFKGLKNEN